VNLAENFLVNPSFLDGVEHQWVQLSTGLTTSYKLPGELSSGYSGKFFSRFEGNGRLLGQGKTALWSRLIG
jgi:hypothetical protein